MKKALYVTDRFDIIYGPKPQAEIARLVDVYAPPQQHDIADTAPELLAEVEIILSGWGAPRLNERFMALCPKLELFLYGAGTIRGFVTDAFWQRDIPICSAWVANGVAVAEYCLSQILFCLKRGYALIRRFKESETRQVDFPRPIPGAYAGVVGIVSLGVIGRRVIELLKPFGVTVLAYDPFVSREEAESLGVRLVSLDELFARADVVSLHTPLMPETEGMIEGRHFEQMMSDAAFLNTARGAVVKEDEMIEVLQRRPDITAVLDVTEPEPPVADSPLWSMPNVILTPHMAGTMDLECHRMADYMVDELKRYLAGEPLQWQVTETRSRQMGVR